MRLIRIKLAGFKSFVDPTTLVLPGNLTGVVGPNGCGKSNIIDAVLWVMGESSAKHLRGDSMADVIFNGSSTRKPVGQASVEIIFDNSDGLIGGEYAGYSEVSIKRTVTRDGVSNYFLNGGRCRRMDITSLFLGTGLGSRSYSVIEQGMISRVIEARPEDLRVFVEEAAGISKYKVRRKDTEHRMHNCKENVSRLNDIRTELDKQLSHLQQQSKAAEKYQELKGRERQLQAQLMGVRLSKLSTEHESSQQICGTRANEVEAVLAKLRAMESETERQRAEQGSCSDRFAGIQREFYSVGATISRLEQTIQHARELRAQQQHELSDAETSVRQLEDQIAIDAERQAQTVSEIAEIDLQHAQLMRLEREALQRLTEMESASQAWQADWDEFQARAADATRDQEVYQTRLAHLDSSLAETAQRIESLTRDKDRLSEPQPSPSLDELGAAADCEEQRLEALSLQQQHKQARAREVRQETRELSNVLDDKRSELQTVRGRLASLEALQQSALGADQPNVVAFLAHLGLAANERLAHCIGVQEGWEWALETAAGIPLDAVCVEDLDAFLNGAASLERGSASAIEIRRLADAQPSEQSLDAPTLADRLTSASPIDDFLRHILTADTVSEARTLLASLQPGQSVVTRDGVWLGHGWVRVRHDRTPESGVLERERLMRVLDSRRAELESAAASLQMELDRTQAELVSLEEDQHAEVEGALQLTRGRLVSLRLEHGARMESLAQARARLEHIDAELHELEQQSEEDTIERAGLFGRLVEKDDEVAQLEPQRAGLVERREGLRETLQSARDDWRKAHEDVYLIALRLGSLRLSAASLLDAVARDQIQVDQLGTRITGLRDQLQLGQAPEAEARARLEEALRSQLRVEAELGAAREALQSVEVAIRELQQARASLESEVQRGRESLEAARMEQRTLEVRMGDLREQLEALGFQLATVLEALPPEANEPDWLEELERTARRIQRLGPINLAAIGEHAQLAERKLYLDNQYTDLTDALATLEEAIRKIDRETRTRFRETFDKVNTGLQSKFPILFGGGHAYLELTGDDLLETGVTVMARPPGKRNGTIHLLSGGEKALTAVALVFAIFDLNPAPFCLLDEVDAPLDDVNVVRLCELLKSMADRIQFIFITHNKITMEIARQLIGVTMQEPGVSRLVAVDMDEAVQLAAVG